MDPTSLLKELQTLDNGRVANEPGARQLMLATAEKLVASLRTPSELLASMSRSETHKYAAMRMAIDLKIFESLTRHGDEGASPADLAKPAGADVRLVSRIMRHLAACWVVDEMGPDLYRNTATSAQLVQRKFSDGVIVLFDNFAPAVQKMPEYVRQNGWKEPADGRNGIYQHAHNTDKHFFEFLAVNPPLLPLFGSYMSGYRQGKVTWFSPEFYPVQNQLIDAQSPDSETVLVDIGGGKGHDLLALVSAFPALKDKVMLQDLPNVLETIQPPLPPYIKTMSHDFFAPQPVKDARAYFMHSCLHNWDDEDCIKILKALKPALKPGYSKVLIHDLVVIDKGAPWLVTSMDLLMCTLLAARERTAAEFTHLFEAAGLQVDKIWIHEPDTEAIIEASLAA